jgi:hypothetical protein
MKDEINRGVHCITPGGVVYANLDDVILLLHGYSEMYRGTFASDVMRDAADGLCECGRGIIESRGYEIGALVAPPGHPLGPPADVCPPSEPDGSPAPEHPSTRREPVGGHVAGHSTPEPDLVPPHVARARRRVARLRTALGWARLCLGLHKPARPHPDQEEV